MKTLLLSAAAVLALAGPSLAAQVTDARAHFAQSEEGGDGARYTGPTSAGDAARVIAHFAASDSGDGANRRDTVAEASDLIVSTSNGGLADFARQKLDNGLKGDN